MNLLMGEEESSHLKYTEAVAKDMGGRRGIFTTSLEDEPSITQRKGSRMSLMQCESPQGSYCKTVRARV